MRISVIFDDELVMVDGVGYRVTLPDEPDVHAIQWTGQTGEIEYRDQHTPNEAIDDQAVLAPYLALWQAAHEAATAPPAEPPRRLIPKSVVQERLNDLGRLGDAFQILNADPLNFGRWFAPNHPNVYADDAGLLTILGPDALDLTAEEIAAITA